MPFTPYHLGPGLLVGLCLFSVLDLTGLLIGSVILDVEPLLVITLNWPLPLHGLAHTYLGATAVGTVTTVVLYLMQRPLSSITSTLLPHSVSSFHRLFFSVLLGAYMHVFLDSLLYPEMNPLFPILGNPFLGLISSQTVSAICLWSGAAGSVLYLVFRVREMGPWHKPGDTNPMSSGAVQ
ncbi:MAG: hypothetical protein HXY34_01790 [Candidatus Thorarchaeota archaeon]|nr:hypothetical protein [Candidatus Thorarchaeota archaeon]